MGYRQSFVFSKEVNFGKGHDAYNMLGMWYAPPPGSEFKCSCAREVQKYTEIGRRVWKDAAYGKISGSWTWTFPLDYNHLEPFMFVYDSYTFQPIFNNEASGERPILGRHIFKHTDSGVTPSFCVRMKTLYSPVGGPGDEVTEVYGCLCTGMRITAEAGNSWSKVTLQGVCTDFSSDVGGDELTALAKTDYTDLEGSKRLVEYMCMKLVEEDSEGNEIKTPLGAIGSMAVQTTNEVVQKYSVLNPVARSRAEESMSHQVSCKVFSVDPTMLRHRVYSGGVKSQARFRYDRVMPLPKLCVEATQQVMATEISVKISITDVVIKMMQFMDESPKIYDLLDSAECTDISLEVVNEVPCKYDTYATGEVVTGQYPIVIRNDDEEQEAWNVVGKHLIVSE